MIGTAAFTRKPRTMKSLQVLNSVQLWRSSAKRECFNRFSRIGFCLSSWTTRSCVDQIRSGFDKKALDWKSQIMTAHNSGPQVPQATRRSLNFSDTEWVTETELEILPDGTANIIQDSDPKSYAKVMDNVNKKVHARHHTSEHGDKMMNQVHSYVIKDRTKTSHLSEDMPSGEDIRSIPVSAYVPSEAENLELQDDFEVHVQRTLVSGLSMFEDLKDCVIWHTPHEFTHESCVKSEFIPTGVLDLDESKTSDMIEIMVTHQKYVPRFSNGNAHRIPYWGDTLSCERGNDAIEARSNGRTHFDKLNTYEVALADWHPRGYAYQDTMDELFEPSSSRSPGTYSYVKNVYRHTAVTPNNVLHSFDKTAEFEEFVGESYILAFACQLLGLSNIRQKSKESPESRLDLLLQTSHDIVSCVFMPPDSSSVINAVIKTGDKQFNYCLCRKDQGGDMIFCENKKCPRGQWFHVGCMDMSADDIPEGSWFCQEYCRAVASTGGVVKGRKQTGGSQKKKKKRDDISDESESESDAYDSKFAYSKAVIWRCLFNKCLHDAIKHNNGPKIISIWKYRLFDLDTFHHPKLMVQAIKLLTAVNGGVSERPQHQLTWCRTANYRGGIGRNVPLDLLMEHLNKEYKRELKKNLYL